MSSLLSRVCWTGVELRRSWFPILVLLFAAVPQVGFTQATDGDDARRLRDELDKARREIQSLRDENARLKGQSPSVGAPAPAATSGVTPAAGPSAGTTAPVAPVANGVVVPPGSVVLPAPVAEGVMVTVAELVDSYRTSPLAGDARYKGRRFRVEGKVRSFKKPFVGMVWTVQLEGADRLGLVRCPLSFPGISDLRESGNGRILEGRRPFRDWQVMLEQGQTVVVEGECTGIDDAVIGFKNCRPASR